MSSTIGASKTFQQNGHGQPHGGGHNGREPEPSDSIPRRAAGPSTKPALIVLGIALFLFVVGAVASGLAGGQGTETPRSASVPTAKGSPLVAEPARSSLSAITASGLPPADIVASIAVPRGTTTTPGSEINTGLGLYDRSVGLAVSASQQKVIAFFRAELPAGLWRVISQGPVAGTYEYRVLAQHPGTNGYEWEIGVTVMPETFSRSESAASSSGSTPFTLRLYEVSYDQ